MDKPRVDRFHDSAIALCSAKKSSDNRAKEGCKQMIITVLQGLYLSLFR